MSLRQFCHLICDVRICSRKILLVKLCIYFECIIQVAENAIVVHYITKLLVVAHTIHSGNSLQQGMIFKLTIKIQYRILGLIKTRKQFIHDNDDFGLIAILKAIDDVLLVLFGGSVLVHHLLPKSQFSVGSLAKCNILTLARIWRSYKHLRRYNAYLIKELLIHYGNSLSWSNQLCLKL